MSQPYPPADSSDAAKVFVPLMYAMTQPEDVLDLGCNCGDWLVEFERLDCPAYGVDCESMAQHVQFNPHFFVAGDLADPMSWIGTVLPVDLVLCLEVAEHLSDLGGRKLAAAASILADRIFWSAAQPGQGGHEHINEQPVSYWAGIFSALGFYAKPLADVLPKHAHDYYRKNMLLLTRQTGAPA